ncbi:hypothetical protein BDF19DRAFT_446459, partial [Syncephalis fuscata]
MSVPITSKASPSSASPLGRVLCTIGLVLLTHAGYSTYEHLSYLKAVARPVDGLPFDV